MNLLNLVMIAFSSVSSIEAWSINTNSRSKGFLTQQNPISKDTTLRASLLDFFSPSKETTSKSEEAIRLKDQICKLAKNTNNGINTPESTQNEINILVSQLEKLNPTPKRSLTADPKLDGSWNLVYTTNGGSSAGKLGPFVGEVEQRIFYNPASKNDNYYINYVRFGGILEGALSANWDVLSGGKWQVNFQTLQFKLLGVKLLDTELKAVGIWRMTYLDDDFRILYASAANADRLEKKKDNNEVVKESVFILTKA